MDMDAVGIFIGIIVIVLALVLVLKRINARGSAGRNWSKVAEPSLDNSFWLQNTMALGASDNAGTPQSEHQGPSHHHAHDAGSGGMYQPHESSCGSLHHSGDYGISAPDFGNNNAADCGSSNTGNGSGTDF